MLFEVAPGLSRSRRAVQTGMRGLRRVLGALGQDLLRHSYYSPVVRIDDLPAGELDRPHQLPGLELALDAQLALLEQSRSSLQEFRPPAGFWPNIMYGALDAEFLYATVIRSRPDRIIELGSGATSLVIGSALRAGSSPVDYRIVDPFPSSLLDRHLSERVLPIGAQELPEEEFAGLAAGDLLVIDTTHTVKVGSEVNRLILEILPILAPGVRVHFHDIFLPYSYPRAYLERHLFYAEQYLLQAFLAFNDLYEIEFAAHALYRAHPAAVRAALPETGVAFLSNGPSSFWIRRR